MPFQVGNQHGKHGNHAKGLECKHKDILRGLRWIQKGDEAIRIPVTDLDTYLAVGWSRGRPKPSIEARRKMSEAQKGRTDRRGDSLTPGRRRNTQYKCRYKRTVEDYEVVFREQGYKCALCTRGESPKRRLCWDHDHTCCPGYLTCGECIRGLLCIPCNKFLGHLERVMKMGKIIPDKNTWLAGAIDYINAFK